MKKLLLGPVFLLAAIILPFTAGADVQVGISIGIPPPIVFPAPPELVVIPSGPSYIYMVPGTVGVYFYGGYWYRSYGGYWYRAVSYNDPWVPIEVGLVPAPVVVVPGDYILNMPPGYRRIPYYDFHRHWKDWERSRYWHNQKWFRDHSQRHWAGQAFHRPPQGHPSYGPRGSYSREAYPKPAMARPQGRPGQGTYGKPGLGGPPPKGGPATYQDKVARGAPAKPGLGGPPPKGGPAGSQGKQAAGQMQHQHKVGR